MYRKDTPNLPRSLKEVGYRTGLIGKLHINPASAFPFDMHEITSANFQRKDLSDYAKHAESFTTDPPRAYSSVSRDGGRTWSVAREEPDLHNAKSKGFFSRAADGTHIYF